MTDSQEIIFDRRSQSPPQADHLHPGGIFALWSADPPEPEYIDTLNEVFAEIQVHEIEFYNPVLDLDEFNTVYVGRVAAG